MTASYLRFYCCSCFFILSLLHCKFYSLLTQKCNVFLKCSYTFMPNSNKRYNNMRKLLFIPILLSLFCCKKDKTDPIPPVHTDLIAPCALNDTVFGMDSVFYGTSLTIPNAAFSVKFMDTTNSTTSPTFIEFAFNKVPTTGMYYLVPLDYLGELELENQISYKEYFGSYWTSPKGTYDNYGNNTDIIYVENNENELIISYCDLIDYTYIFDPNTITYIGNIQGYMKYTKKY